MRYIVSEYTVTTSVLVISFFGDVYMCVLALVLATVHVSSRCIALLVILSAVLVFGTTVCVRVCFSEDTHWVIV